MSRALLCISILVSSVSALGAADDAFREAKDEYQKLKSDKQRRALRHHWQNVAKKFEAVATKYAQSARAPEALFNSGELNNELSRFSGRDEDREAAKRDYRKLLAGWPDHRLADDAAFALARLLADREGDSAGARRVLDSGLKTAGDRKKEMQNMLAALPREAPKPAAPTARKAPAVRVSTPPPPPVHPRPPANDVAEAIRRAVNPMLRSPAGAEGRSPHTQAGEADEPIEDSEDLEPEPALSSLTEKLRDVRVGVPLPNGEDPQLRSRFKKLAKEVGGAELSLAQQLGLKVRRIVVDAGHGGHDTGAIGPKGTREKDVSLAIAKKLAARLEEAGLEVLMTRDDDTYVKLEDRTHFANQHKGDLFISVHCNAAARKTLRGIETYTLNTSSNRYAIRLAARENATSERGVGDLQYILADLATKANTGESGHLAQRVQRSLVRNLSSSYKGVMDLGNKEALFFVLLGAKMPAILVETSFLSHPEEEQRLGENDYQQKVADSIAEAVSGFLEARNKVAQVD